MHTVQQQSWLLTRAPRVGYLYPSFSNCVSYSMDPSYPRDPRSIPSSAFPNPNSSPNAHPALRTRYDILVNRVPLVSQNRILPHPVPHEYFHTARTPPPSATPWAKVCRHVHTVQQQSWLLTRAHESSTHTRPSASAFRIELIRVIRAIRGQSVHPRSQSEFFPKRTSRSAHALRHFSQPSPPRFPKPHSAPSRPASVPPRHSHALPSATPWAKVCRHVHTVQQQSWLLTRAHESSTHTRPSASAFRIELIRVIRAIRGQSPHPRSQSEFFPKRTSFTAHALRHFSQPSPPRFPKPYSAPSRPASVPPRHSHTPAECNTMGKGM